MNRLIFFGLIAILSLISCDSDFGGTITDPEEEEVTLPEGIASTILNIHLTDDPIDLDEVNIDLQQVFVKGPDGFEEIPIGTNEGIYDLLDLQNGVDVIIASADDLEIDQIREVRLVLGDNNSVVVEGETFDLKIPSGSQSGLKIKVCLDLTEDMPEYSLLLDFDAAESVRVTGNGKYMMHPVIRVMNPDAQCDDDDDKDDDTDLDDLPDGIVEWLDENYSDHSFKVEETSLCNEGDVYKIKATKDQERVYLFFDLDGNFLQSAAAIANEDLPEAVTTAVADDYPDHQLKDNNKTFRITTADESIRYQVRVNKEDGNLDLIYDEDGNFVCASSIVDDDDDDKPSLDNLPQNVKDLLNDNYADYNFKIEKQPFCDNSEIYLLSGEDETETIQVLLYFDADWALVQTGVPVSKSDIPEAVLGSIAEDYPEYSIMNNNTWEIERAGGDIWYRVYLKQDKGSKKIHAIYTADGTFICQEE